MIEEKSNIDDITMKSTITMKVTVDEDVGKGGKDESFIGILKFESNFSLTRRAPRMRRPWERSCEAVASGK